MDRWFAEFLACPDCGNEVAAAEGWVVCNRCRYRATAQERQIDLKPSNPAACTLVFQRSSSAAELLKAIPIERPACDYDGPPAARDSREFASVMRPYLPPAAKVLDLGCGPRDQAPVFEHLGCKYVGMDYSGSAADILADAHAIPFRSETFDAVFSYAVLEHLYNPFLAIVEIHRVLKPGGIYCGTVSQGEPFHNSYFHHSAWGLLSLVETSGMNVQRMWPSRDTLRALSSMGKYPRVVRALLRAIDVLHARLPILAPQKMLRWSERDRKLDELYRAGSICFLIQKSAATG